MDQDHEGQVQNVVHEGLDHVVHEGLDHVVHGQENHEAQVLQGPQNIEDLVPLDHLGVQICEEVSVVEVYIGLDVVQMLV
jgi:hypothetical protein